MITGAAEAIEYRVFGPPGTGKTTYLIHSIQNALEKYAPEDILVCSYTRAAAIEIKRRVKHQFQEQAEGIQVGTLHSICFNLLDRPDLTERHLKDWNERYPQYRISFSDDLDNPYPVEVARTKGEEMFLRIQNYRARMIDPTFWDRQAREFYRLWCRWKEELGLVDFTDLLEEVLRKQIMVNAKVGFFDEAQDFSQLQISVVRMWKEGMDYIIIAGDDDQVLYQWCGATAEVMLKPRIPDKQIRVLKRSYRLPIVVKEYADRWIQQIRGERQPKEYEAAKRYVGEVRHVPDITISRPDKVLRLMESYKDETWMILTTCSYMLDKIIAEFRRAGIYFWNPYRKINGKWNPIRSGGALDALVAFMRGELVDYELYWEAKDVAKWIKDLSAKCFQGKKKDVLAEINQLAKEDPTAKISHARIPLTDEVAIRTLDRDVGMFLEYVIGSRRKSYEYPVMIIKKQGIEALQTKPKVVVGTIHSVKGGEADNVLVFPDLSLAGWREWLGRGRDDVIRQFYVAITRAKKRLFLGGATSAQRITWLR